MHILKPITTCDPITIIKRQIPFSGQQSWPFKNVAIEKIKTRLSKLALHYFFTFIVFFFCSSSVHAYKPNILIFLSDDMGYGDSLVYNPNSKIPMPNLDRLAEEGMVFTDVHTSASYCAPSRYSVMTGNYQWRGLFPEGQWEYKGGSQILEDQMTLADILEAKRYRTSIFGKLHFGGEFYKKQSSQFADLNTTDDQIDFGRGLFNGPLTYGFYYSYVLLRGIQRPPYAYFENDQLVGQPEDLITWRVGTYGNSEIMAGGKGIGMPDYDSSTVGPELTQKAIDFIDQHHQMNIDNGTNKPFFLYYASQSAHQPWTPPAYFHGSRVKGVTGMTPHTDMIYEIDVALGKLIGAIEDIGLIDNTLIIFTSDNGGKPDEVSYGHDAVGGLRGRKGTIWEGGHRVPFIAKWGDGTLHGSVIQPGTSSSQLLGVHDLAATLAALTNHNLPIDQARDSFNFLPVLIGDQEDTDPVRDHLIMEDLYWDGADKQFRSQSFAFRMNQWKLILDDRYRVSGLYDLDNDLSESNNLKNDPNHSNRIDNMRNQFIERRNSARSSPSLQPETDCQNGEDDDGDRLYDCDDPDCHGTTHCDTGDAILNVFSPVFNNTSTWAVYKDTDDKDTKVITFADGGAPGEKYKTVIKTTKGDTINYLFTSKSSGYTGCDKSAHDGEWPEYRKIELGSNAGYAKLLKMKMIKRKGTGSRNAYVGFHGSADEGWTQSSGPADGCGWTAAYDSDDAMWIETDEMQSLPMDISDDGPTLLAQSEDPDGDDTKAWMIDISATASGNVFSPVFNNTSTWVVYKDTDNKDTKVITFADGGAPGEKYKVVIKTTTGDTIIYLFTSKGSGYTGCDKSAYDGQWPGYRQIGLGSNAGFAKLLKIKMIKRKGTGTRNAYVGFSGSGDEGWSQSSGPADGCGW